MMIRNVRYVKLMIEQKLQKLITILIYIQFFTEFVCKIKKGVAFVAFSTNLVVIK